MRHNCLAERERAESETRLEQCRHTHWRLRNLVPALAILCFAIEGSAQQPLVSGVDSVGYTVGDMDSAVSFFTDVLTFEKIADEEVVGEDFESLFRVFGARIRLVRLKLGEEYIVLKEFISPRGKPIPIDSRSNDGWFQHIAIVVSDMDEAYGRLRTFKVEHASPEPQTLPNWNLNAGGIKAFYFKDPEGHVLELLEFPKGKGDKRWQSKDRLFLGIDHTAIVVADTNRALKFYRNVLGMKVAGESENYGLEQERLNNVFGARLRITGLRASNGPGIELLEYLAPRNGRIYPQATDSNDLWHWQTVLNTDDVARAAMAIRQAKADWVSPRVTNIENDEFGIDKGIMVSGPFGHQMLLIESLEDTR